MEPAQVATQQTIDDGFTPVQDVEHICRREGGVVEEGNFDIGHFFPNVIGSQPQVVIMNPDQGIVCGLFDGGIGKELVCKDGPVFTLDQINKTPREY